MSTNYKADFPLLAQRDVAYLDSAATAQRPQCVLDAEREFYTRHNANPLRGLYPLSIEATDALESARAAVARFLGAPQSEELVFTRNTTEGLNLVAYSYGLSHVKAGDEILISTMEHHSNILPWQMVCRQTGAQLKFMECEPDGSLDLNKVEALITARTRVVALQQVSNVLGREYPIRAVAELAHRVGAVLVVDGAQSTPHLPVNVQELGADFLAFSGHKLYGPMGIGALYGRRELLEQMPPFLTGGEMIESVTREGAVFAEAPHKFEAGTVNAGGAVALAAAIDYLESVGLENVHAQEQALTRYAYEGMKKISGVNILGSDDPDKHCGILSFTVDGVHPHDIATILDSCHVDVRAGHHCAQPLLAYLGVRSCARASLAFYNTTADIDRFLAALGGVRKEMGYAE
jgi:cysteine desulfurase/selenocysteine lyase